VFLAIVAVAIGGGLLVAFSDDGTGIENAGVTAGIFLMVIAGWGVSLCLHEFGHAIVAYRGGDREVYFKGYLTLDPRRYTDPVFSLVLPLLILAIGGIPLPGGAVWINHHSLRNKRTESWVSLAGPLSNLAMGALLIGAVSILFPSQESIFEPISWLSAGLSYLALLQIFAFILNILPIPGLDGWGALEPWLPHDWQRFGAKARPWAPLILFAVLIGIPQVGYAFSDFAFTVYDLVGGDSGLAANGGAAFRFWN
jgi:Zn-dependent protease